jgi:hypothetical protein
MWLWPISRHLSGSSKENHKESVRIFGDLTEIQIWHLPNTSQKCYCINQFPKAER